MKYLAIVGVWATVVAIAYIAPHTIGSALICALIATFVIAE